MEETSRRQEDRRTDRLTEAMDRVLDQVGLEVGEFTKEAGRQVLERVEW